MILKCFVVKDMKAQLFLQPNFQRSVAEAMRSWEVVANEGESAISKFPHDFRLFCIGEFDDVKGELTPQAAQDLGSAFDVKRKPKEQLPFDMRRDEKL